MQPLTILKKAQKQQAAIGQFNTSNFEITKAILNAAKQTKAPVIIGTSEGERDFFGASNIAFLIKAFKKTHPYPVILHSDHCKSLESFKKAVKAGYDSVHIDGSELDYRENLALTKKAVDYARRTERNIMVEGELGKISGGSEAHPDRELKIEASQLTPPEKVEPFVQKTGIDTLAIAIGTAHGTYKSKPSLNFELLKNIRKKTDLPLVLHGGSGTSDNDLKKTIQAGITKININTALRKAYAQTLRQTLASKPDTITPYKIMPPVIKAVEEKVKQKIKLFNSQLVD